MFCGFIFFALWVAFVWVGEWITVALCGLRQAYLCLGFLCGFFLLLSDIPLVPPPAPILCGFLVFLSFWCCHPSLSSRPLAYVVVWLFGVRAGGGGLVWVDLGGGGDFHTLQLVVVVLLLCGLGFCCRALVSCSSGFFD